MAFTVKEVGEVKTKSIAQQEKEVLKEHEEKVIIQAQTQDNPTPAAEPEIDEEKILNFIESKHGKKFSRLEELLQPVAPEPERLPEDVEAFLKFKKETGRSLNEFVLINRDLDKLDPEAALREYYAIQNPELDEDEIDFMLDDFRETDIDDEVTVKKKNIRKKQEFEKAKSFFKSQAEKYKAPLESRDPVMNEEQRAEYEAFKEYIAKSKNEKEAAQRKSEWFQKKTDEVFSENFKGFEFKISEDKSAVFSPAEKSVLKQNQLSINNFVKKFLNQEGLIEDASGYHKALAVAMNADQFAKHFYELGAAEAIENTAKKDKNINFGLRTTPSSMQKGGFKVSEVEPSSGNRLVIRANK